MQNHMDINISVRGIMAAVFLDPFSFLFLSKVLSVHLRNTHQMRNRTISDKPTTGIYWRMSASKLILLA